MFEPISSYPRHVLGTYIKGDRSTEEIRSKLRYSEETHTHTTDNEKVRLRLSSPNRQPVGDFLG